MLSFDAVPMLEEIFKFYVNVIIETRGSNPADASYVLSEIYKLPWWDFLKISPSTINEIIKSL